MQISRRSALIGASAAVVTGAAVVPLAIKAAGVKAALAGDPMAVQGDDAVLLARIAEFQDLYGRWQSLWAKQRAHRARIEAMPDCPELDGTVEGNQAYFAFLEAHDAYRYHNGGNGLSKSLGASVNAVFKTPAKTIEGVFGKARILYLARGDYDGHGDDDLEGFQDNENCPWFGSVIADLERLGGMRS